MAASVTRSPPAALNASPAVTQGRESEQGSLQSQRGSPSAKVTSASPSESHPGRYPASVGTSGQEPKQTSGSAGKSAWAKLLKGSHVPHPPLTSASHSADQHHTHQRPIGSSGQGQATGPSAALEERETPQPSKKEKLASMLRRVAMAVRFKQKRYNPNERSECDLWGCSAICVKYCNRTSL